MKHNAMPEILSGDELADQIAQLHPSLRATFVYDPPKRLPVQASVKRQRGVRPEGFDTVTTYSQVDLQRVRALIQRLHYGDCLTCGDWTLDRQCCQVIRDLEDDHAPDGTLVNGSYADYLLYRADRLVGVFDMRAEAGDVSRSTIQEMAVYLCQRGWTARNTRRIEYGAITPQQLCLSRAKRLLKQPAATGQQAAI